jgi:7-cyano-7-deazaguanine synthase
MKEKVVVSLSGGMDSTSLLLHFLSRGFTPSCLGFLYGQRHRRELQSAKNIASRLNVPFQTVVLSSLQPLLEGSALTDNIDVPEGHYAHPNMRVTVVPNRNAIFLNIAAAYAMSQSISLVAYGAHSGDHDIYPDCRIEFVNLMQDAINAGSYEKIKILTPYISLDKGRVLQDGIRAAHELGVDAVEIYSMTWTCYKGGERACGRCGSCVERLEAFESVGMKDPIEYEGRGN